MDKNLNNVRKERTTNIANIIATVLFAHYIQVERIIYIILWIWIYLKRESDFYGYRFLWKIEFRD